MPNIDYRPDANLDRVQFERVRKVVDVAFNAAMHELDECFYGDRAENGAFKRDGLTGWKHGKSAPFRGYDIVVSTLPAAMRRYLGAEQQALSENQAAKMFNIFAGMMNLAREVALVKANRNLADPYPEEKINPIIDRSKNRLFKEAKAKMEAEFERRLRENPDAVQTFGDMVALWNSIPLDAGQHATEPVPVNSAAAEALAKLRALEAATGIKARELVGTLPEA